MSQMSTTEKSQKYKPHVLPFTIAVKGVKFFVTKLKMDWLRRPFIDLIWEKNVF